MTPADHAALSAQLARALGWRIVDVVEVTDYEGLFVDTVCKVRHKGARFSRLFDYRDATIALPVLEWLRTKHSATLGTDARSGRPYIALWEKHNDGAPMVDWRIEADTLHEAIARAAIAVGGGKRQQVEQNEAREVLQA